MSPSHTSILRLLAVLILGGCVSASLNIKEPTKGVPLERSQAMLDSVENVFHLQQVDSFSTYAFQEFVQPMNNYGEMLWFTSRVINENAHTGYRPELNIDNKIGDTFKFDRYNGKEFYFFYLWSRLSKTNSSIRQKLSSANKQLILDLFRNADHYERSGVKHLVNALLLSYEEIGQDERLLNTLYERSKEVSVIGDPYYDELTSDQVREALDEGQPDVTLISPGTAESWVYSFWVRRHQEKNKKQIYKLLREFKEAMETPKGI